MAKTPCLLFLLTVAPILQLVVGKASPQLGIYQSQPDPSIPGSRITNVLANPPPVNPYQAALLGQLIRQPQQVE